MITPRVSVVTLSFNQGRYLRQAIESVLLQTYVDLEYIIVDPGSDDGSRRIIGEYSGRVKTIFEPDNGPADGLNKGFRIASGDVFAFLNADDFLLPDAIQRVATLFMGRRDAEVIYGHGYIVDVEGKITRRFRSDPFSPRRCAFGASVLMQQSTFFRSTAFHRVGGFNPTNRTCWDGELFLDMALKGCRMLRSNQYWSAFRLHRESISGSGKYQQLYLQDRARLFEKVMGRTERSMDGLWCEAAKFEKLLVDPALLYWKIRDRVAGLPQLAFT